MPHYSDLTLLCEKIANRKDLPGRVTDWAAELYAAMIDKDAIIESKDLMLLQFFEEDEERDLYCLDHYLITSTRN